MNDEDAAENIEQSKDESSEMNLPVLPLFGKWDMSEVVVEDPSLAKALNLDSFRVPHTGGRHANKPLGKANLPILERFINNMMRSEKYTGKKVQAYNVVNKAFDIIYEKKKENPVQILVRALENASPRAEVVSLRYGGIRVYSGVDVSPTRRIDVTLRHICQGAIEKAGKARSIEKALSKELMLASEGNAESFAVSKKEEKERQAEAAH